MHGPPSWTRCSASAAGRSSHLRDTGGPLPLAEVAAEAFERTHPELRVNVQGGGSGVVRAHGLDGIPVRIERSLRQAALWEEVADRLDSPAASLSGGQMQRLCLARALALEPQVLLLDEPCAALDPASTMRVEEALRGLAGQVTRVIVTHNLGQARRLADQCLALWPGVDGGEVAACGPVHAVLDGETGPLGQWLRGALG